MGTAIGATAGSIIPGVGTFGGAMTGFGIGGAMDLTLGVLGRRGIEAASLGEGFRGIAERNFGPISQSAGRRMGEVLQDEVYSYEGRALDVDMEQLQSNVLAFDNAGGFSNVTSSDEMERVLEGVVENARQFANTFKMKQEQAVQVMAELQKSMVVTTEEMGDFSSRMGHLGGVTGLGAAGVTEFGLQGVDMFRGTGIPASQRFNMALEARTQAERLKYSDPTTRQLVADAGGADGFALRALERSQSYLMSGQGMLHMTNLLGGGEAGAGIPSMLNNSAMFYGGDPQQILKLQANASQLAGALGPGIGSNMMVSMAYNQLDTLGMTGPDGRIDEDVLISTIANQTGMSIEAARSTFVHAKESLNDNPVEREFMDFMRARRDTIEENRTSAVGRGLANVGEFFEGITTFEPAGDAALGIWGGIVEGVKDAGAWWRGDVRLEGIYLNERDRETYREMSESGEFDIDKFDEEGLTPDEIKAQRAANRQEDGAKRIQDLKETSAGSVFDSGSFIDPTQFTDRELNMIAGGSTSTDETMSRLAVAGEEGLGGNIANIIDLPSNVDAELQSRVDKATHRVDVKNLDTAADQLNAIAVRAGFGMFKDATPEERSAVYNRFMTVSSKSEEVDNLRKDIESFESGEGSLSQVEALENKAQGFEDKYEQGLDKLINEADAQYRSSYEGGSGSFEELFGDGWIFEGGEDDIRSAIRRGTLDELDTSDFSKDQKEYINILSSKSETKDLAELMSRSNATRAEKKRLLRTARQTAAAGIMDPENEKAYSEILGGNMRDTLENAGVVESGEVYDFEQESGASDFIRDALDKSGAKNISESVKALEDSNSYEEFASTFKEIIDKVDDPTFITQAALKFENPYLRESIMQFQGDDAMTRLNSIISDKGLQVVVQNGSSMFFTHDSKD